MRAMKHRLWCFILRAGIVKMEKVINTAIHFPIFIIINKVQAVDDIDKLCKFHENLTTMQT